jgi:type II secretory pathway pseudopilin PulG
MLVVIVVIAVLATMVIGLASRIDNQGKERSVKAVLAQLDAALQEYHEFTNTFPAQPEKDFANAPAHSELLYKELDSMPESRSVLTKINDSFIENKYSTADSSPEIYDSWGRALDYIYSPDDNYPLLISAGSDKIFGTADDVTNR